MSNQEDFAKELRLWCVSSQIQKAIEKREFEKLDSLHRMIVLRNGYLANLIALCRQNPRMDSRPAILGLITFFSDNGNFLCTLKIRDMAQMLCRDQRNVRESVNWLRDQNVIGVNETENGLPNSYWPRLTVAVLDSTASIFWFSKSLTTLPGKPGRPRNEHGTGENTPDVCIPGIKKYPGCRATNTPDVEAHRELTNEFTQKNYAQQAAPVAQEASPELPLGCQAHQPQRKPATKGGEEFEAAWEAYRKASSRSPGSKTKALAQFERLTPEDRALVIPAIKAYADDCAKQQFGRGDHRSMCDMDRFLRDYFEQFKPTPKAPEYIESNQIRAVALDLANGERPEHITKYGWQSFEAVKVEAPQIWKAGMGRARDLGWQPSARAA
jgi:hypothetical protein